MKKKEIEIKVIITDIGNGKLENNFVVNGDASAVIVAEQLGILSEQIMVMIEKTTEKEKHNFKSKKDIIKFLDGLKIKSLQ